MHNAVIYDGKCLKPDILITSVIFRFSQLEKTSKLFQVYEKYSHFFIFVISQTAYRRPADR